MGTANRWGARKAWVAATVQATGPDSTWVGELLATYGTTARVVGAHRSRWLDTDRLPGSRSYSGAEIDWIGREEGVTHLADVVIRRTTLAVTGSLTGRDLDAIAEVTSAALRPDEVRARMQLKAVRAHLKGPHRMRLTRAS